MEETNYYNILGINYRSTPDEIKKAFRKLSLDYHPDRNNNDVEKTKIFKKINDAYETLSDPIKRKNYDNYINILNLGNLGNLGNIGNIGNLGNLGNLDSNFTNIEDILKSDIFNSLFNVNEINNLNKLFNINTVPLLSDTVSITLEQSYSGISLPIVINKWRIENGLKIEVKETIYIDLVSGIDNGEILLLKNKGNYVNNHLIGDLEITVYINQHNIFQRNGLNLYYVKNITFKQAFCGFSFDLPFLNGKQYKIKNNEGNIIYPGYEKVVNNFGMKRNNNIGDLIIKFNIEFPKSINEVQIKLINDNF